MEIGHYVNVPIQRERRQRELKKDNCSSGKSTIYKLVGLSFGLLCILQSALNIFLWQKTVEISNSSNSSTCNVTSLSADAIRVLVFERDQLKQEKEQHVKEIHDLKEKTERLIKDKKQLAQKEHKLLEKKNQLQLRNDKCQNQLSKLTGQNTPECPTGWWRFRSRCYQLSNFGKTWIDAKQNCERKGAHLLILNDNTAMEAVSRFGGGVRMWIGLSCHRNPYTHSWDWTWVDVNQLDTWYLCDPYSAFGACRTYPLIDQSLQYQYLTPLFKGNCQGQSYVMCEKELSTTFI